MVRDCEVCGCLWCAVFECGAFCCVAKNAAVIVLVCVLILRRFKASRGVSVGWTGRCGKVEEPEEVVV